MHACLPEINGLSRRCPSLLRHKPLLIVENAPLLVDVPRPFLCARALAALLWPSARHSVSPVSSGSVTYLGVQCCDNDGFSPALSHLIVITPRSTVTPILYINCEFHHHTSCCTPVPLHFPITSSHHFHR